MNPIASVTRWLQRRVDDAGFVANLLVRALLLLPRTPRRTRFLLDNAFNAGVRALPVTMIVAAFAGAILAMQTGIELRRFGDTAVLGTITALSMCREMGPFITGVIIAATVGSSMAAELGTMKVSEEIDALEVMSVDPVELPGAAARSLALAVMCPMHDRVLSNLMGIVGGQCVGGCRTWGSAGELYWNTVHRPPSRRQRHTSCPKTVYVGLFKSFVFGTAHRHPRAVLRGCGPRGGALGVGLAVQQRGAQLGDPDHRARLRGDLVLLLPRVSRPQ